jgi:dihydrofolate synthase / folylpolyglutamate synthase
MIKNIQELNNYLDQFRGFNFAGGTVKPEIAIEKCNSFNKLIGNPENKLNIIHVAGTSGKGSTCFLLANLLDSQGFKTGLAVSPHLASITERFVVNNQKIEETKLINYFGEIEEKLNFFQANSKYGPLSFFEIVTALQFYIFQKERVNYAIMETGMGGRLDATNVPVSSKLCVLTQIGMDHTRWLGDTIDKIATEKAGIIQPNCSVIALSQIQSVNNIFIEQSEKVGVEVDFVVPNFDFGNINIEINSKNIYTSFEYIDQDLNERVFKLKMLGDYQAVNCSLALRSLEELSENDDWEIDWQNVLKCLSNVKLDGRFEIIDFGQNKIILDGAHNTQKLNAFLKNLFKVYPNKKVNLVIGFKKDKNIDEMIIELNHYKEKYNQITLTEFETNQDSQIKSFDSQELLVKCEKLGLVAKVEPSIRIIISQLLTQNNSDDISNKGVITVFTGSLYLVGAVKELLDYTQI